MTQFKPEDRNMLVETHTLLKTHVKTMNKITEDHELRLRTVETRQTKIMAVFALIFTGIGSVFAATFNKFIS